MKHVVAGLAGLVVGAVAAAALVYVNPLTADPVRPAPVPDGWRLAYSFPGSGVLTHTHGGGVPSQRLPAGVGPLWEETIASTALTTLRLDDARDGGAAWATRISVPSTRTNLLLNGVVVDDHWLISKPGAGALFMTAHTNLWPVLKDTYVRVDVLRRPWGGPASYSPTLRSPGSPAVHGATGAFAGVAGRGRERLEVAGYDPARGVASLSGRLVLELDGGALAEVAAE